MQLYICLLSFLSCCYCCCFIDELQLLFSQKQQQHLFNLTSVCVCVRVHLYMSLFEARHVRLFIYAFVCHSFSPQLTYMCLCVCVCVCLCLFVSAAVAGTALQLPVGKDEFTLLFFLLRRLVVVAVFVGLPLFLSTTLIYHWHCNLDKLF